jgi:molybdenum cofactor cytidylyltransferase
VNVGIVLLAAGRAVRFGADKRRALLPDGRTVLETTVANARASGLPLLVCVGSRDDALLPGLLGSDTALLRCSRAGEGMGGTLAQAANQIPGWEGALVALADMPWIVPASFRSVAEALAKDCIVVPSYRGRRGHPVGFGSDFFAALGALGGDAGARQLLDEHPERVRELALADPGIYRDIDLPSDLAPAAGR